MSKRRKNAIHHAAAVYYLGAKKEDIYRVNVEGTRTVLEVASDCPNLRRFNHWSTAHVSGARSGVILEEGSAFEQEALDEYHKLLALSGGDVALEELARQQILKEQSHIEEVEKMLRGMKDAKR